MTSRFCVCIYINGRCERGEAAADECVAVLQDMIGMTQEEAVCRLVDAALLGAINQTEPYDLSVEYIGWLG
jgi:hypothetical protein